jgi:hypothetical protein
MGENCIDDVMAATVFRVKVKVKVTLVQALRLCTRPYGP